MRIAPHLVHLEPFTVPLHGSPLQVPYLGSGLVLYGLLGAGFPRYLTPGAAKRAVPALRSERLRGAYVYRDGVEDDARLVIAVCRTAMARGAVAVTRVRAESLSQAGGRVTGVDATDLVSGEHLSIAADAVIDATGATGGPGGPFARDAGEVRVMPSLGIHLVIDRARLPASGGLTMRVPGRVLFLIPWGRRWIVGTTDHPWDGPVDRPTAPADQVDEVLGNLAASVDAGITRRDVLATFAGIRPLAATSDESTVTASREHVIGSPVPGLATVRGGKYTTYRRIAADAVDVSLGPRHDQLRSATADLRLVGADGGSSTNGTTPDIDPGILGSLTARYGSETREVLAMGAERGLLGRLHPDTDHLEVEAVWAVERELAWSLDDILARRLRLAIETADHGASVAARVADLVGPELGWDDGRRAAEVAAYTASSAREYGVP
jgi:glycerol-3-phosphate dehydrogenase